MPKNRWIYIGTLFVAASALIYAGTELGKRIEVAVPYALGFGALLIVVGLVLEAKKKKNAAEGPEQKPTA